RPANGRLQGDQRFVERIDRRQMVPVGPGMVGLGSAELEEVARAESIALPGEPELLGGRRGVPFLERDAPVSGLKSKDRFGDQRSPLELRRAPSLARVLGGHPRGLHLTPTLEAREYRDRDLELREDRLTRELEGEDIVLGDD